MKTFIRKLSVLTVLFSGMFIFLGDVVAAVFRIQAGSIVYCLLQGGGVAFLGILLHTRKLQIL